MDASDKGTILDLRLASECAFRQMDDRITRLVDLKRFNLQVWFKQTLGMEGTVYNLI